MYGCRRFLPACAVMAVWALCAGCAVTDYGLITDNNQVSHPGGPGEILDTRGKAKLIFSSQWANLYTDGTDELLSFVDQDASGGQTINSYNN